MVNPDLKTFEEKTIAIENVLKDLKNRKIFKKLDGWRNEHYNVKEKFNSESLFTIERSAASLLGIRQYGCHINGYVKKDGLYYIWIAKRSTDKQTYPGMLDNFVNC